MSSGPVHQCGKYDKLVGWVVMEPELRYMLVWVGFRYTLQSMKKLAMTGDNGELTAAPTLPKQK